MTAGIFPARVIRAGALAALVCAAFAVLVGAVEEAQVGGRFALGPTSLVHKPVKKQPALTGHRP